MPVAAAAGFWRRYVAWTLDATLLALPLLALAATDLVREGAALRTAAEALLADVATRLLDAAASTGSLQAVVHDVRLREAAQALQRQAWDALQPWLGWWLAAAALYWVGFECSRWQATPGKRALGLVVVGQGGRRPGCARAAWRHVAGTLSWLTLNLGHLLATVPPTHRALHDRLSGSAVLARHPGSRLPGFARAWLALQVIAGVAAAVALLGWSAAAVEQALLRAGG